MDPTAYADLEYHDSFALASEVVVTETVRDKARKLLHQAQLVCFDCDARVRNVLGGRQGGKSFELAVELLTAGLEHASTLNLYLALTTKSARRIMWVEVVRAALELGLDPSCLHEHTLEVKLPNGSAVLLAGTDDVRTIETLRGLKVYLLAIDEMGAQPDNMIGYVIHLLWPTMIRHNGRMVKAGNPGLTLIGQWYDETGPASTSPIPRFRYTAWDNPGLGGYDAVERFVAEYLASTGIQRDSATFRREWLAEWVEDAGALVYPFDYARNGVDGLPTLNSLSRRIDASAWRYVVAVDPAGVGVTGVSVLAAHPELTTCYVVESEAHPAILIAQLAGMIEVKQAMYSRAQIVMDVGGLGSTHAQEFQRVHALGVTPAEKSEKKSSIRFTRDWLLAGRLKVVNGPQNQAVRSEWATLGWDAKREQHHPDQADHVADTVLYGVRYLRSYVRSERQPDPEHGTDAWMDAEAEKLRSARERQVRRDNRGGRRAWT